LLLGCILGGLLGWRGSRRWFGVGLVSLLALELVAGVFAFVALRTEGSWAHAQLGTGLAALAVFGERLRRRDLSQQRLDAELAIARTVQTSLLPPSAIVDERLAIAAYCQPCSECGGDWWGVFRQADASIVVLGDATGHGVAAALVSAMAHATIEAVLLRLTDDGRPAMPGEVLEHLNRVLLSLGRSEVSFCCVVLRFDFALGRLIYANAGLGMPYLFPKDPKDQRLEGVKHVPFTLSRHRSLRGMGNPLGLVSRGPYREHTIPLAVGDRLLVYTDGLTECRDLRERPLRRAALLRCCEEDRGVDPGTVRDRIAGLVSAHRGGRPAGDDTTFLVVDVRDDDGRDATVARIPA
jgi:serine phosphatase RsbU (regulator of sigma subunit)